MRGTYTTEDKLKFDFKMTYNFDLNYRMYHNIKVNNRPNTFYGIGNLTKESEYFDERNMIIYNDFFLEYKQFDFTISLSQSYYDVRSYISDGMLQNQLLHQKQKFFTSGVGAGVMYDFSNHKNYPSTGSRFAFHYKKFHKYLGSDYNFEKYHFAASRYFAIHKKMVFAVQGLFRTSNGKIPFQEMWKLGANMRGIKSNRFIDKSMLNFRSELRIFPFESDKHKRFGFVLFAEEGQVANNKNELFSNEKKFCFGGGVRYSIFEKEKLNLRIDFGIFEDSYGFTINVGEAF